MAYQGWNNWETWNVALWLGNDEGIYCGIIYAAKRAGHGDPIDEDQAEALVCSLMPDGTPDFDKGARSYAAVDWPEIAACINEMAGLEADDNEEEARQLKADDNDDDET